MLNFDWSYLWPSPENTKEFYGKDENSALVRASRWCSRQSEDWNIIDHEWEYNEDFEKVRYVVILSKE